jgi:anaerobic selenocysteine-containing dehydrogenase
VIRETAHAFARADRAMICWTLGITEHHNAVDNVLSLINLGLLCGHVGRYGSGSTRCAARTTSRAAATWARSRTSCPASRTSSATTRRAPLRGGVGDDDPARSTAGT